MNKPTIEELEAQVKQLAAENAALKLWASQSVVLWDAGCDMDGHMHDLPRTVNTDSYTASLRAEGLEMFSLMYAEEAIKDCSDNTDWKARASAAAFEYAAQLRSKPEVQS